MEILDVKAFETRFLLSLGFPTACNRAPVYCMLACIPHRTGLKHAFN
jgi:hypothetical protein